MISGTKILSKNEMNSLGCLLIRSPVLGLQQNNKIGVQGELRDKFSGDLIN